MASLALNSVAWLVVALNCVLDPNVAWGFALGAWSMNLVNAVMDCVEARADPRGER